MLYNGIVKTIILTSAGFKTPELQREFLKALPKPPASLKLAYVTTASKVEENKDFVERDRKILIELGFQMEEIDIEGKDYEELKILLKNKDIIFVQGGNTFYLLKHVRSSGFEREVKELLEQGVIYVGVSAGSYVACPTIDMATWKHQDRERYGVTDLNAMNLVPFLLSVHYNREKYREALLSGAKDTKLPLRILTDDQALLVKDREVTLIGSPDEVKL